LQSSSRFPYLLDSDRWLDVSAIHSVTEDYAASRLTAAGHPVNLIIAVTVVYLYVSDTSTRRHALTTRSHAAAVPATARLSNAVLPVVIQQPPW
jgi:hypothetical protein